MRRALLFILLISVPLCISAQWEVVYTGGTTYNDMDLFFLSADTGFVIGTDQAGAYVLRTYDGGVSWDSTGYSNYLFRTIYFPSKDTGYISGYFHNYHPGVMRTTDGGDNWQIIDSNLVSATSVPLAISFFNNDTGIISTGGWAAKTIDAGMSWTTLNNFVGGGTNDNDIKNHLLVGADGVILEWSNDYGNSFYVDTLQYSGSHQNLQVLNDSNFVSCAIGDNGYAMGYSFDNYGIMTLGNVIANNFRYIYFPHLVGVLAVSKPSSNVIYALSRPDNYNGSDYTSNFMKSTDGGHTWYYQGIIGESPWESLSMWLDCVNDSVCYAVGGANGKIYKTTNGGGPLLSQVNHVTVGIDEPKAGRKTEVYPNPSGGKYRITVGSVIKRLDVFDITGKLVKEVAPESLSAELDLSGEKDGVYTVEVYSGGQVETFKLIKK